MIATGSARPFVRRPRLPLVPPPHTGESLSGWIEAISGTYGFGWREFLQTLRIKPPARLRSLNIDPPWPSLLALEEQTGVAAAFMRDHMTFEQLSTHMAWFVHEAAPCRACAAYKRPGDARQIEWLDDLAPWQFVCDRHPCPTLANEVGRSGMRDTIDRDVKALQNCLRSTACSKARWPFPSVPTSTAMCIDMVAAINSRLRLRVQAQNGADRIVFAVDDILMARQIDAVLCINRHKRNLACTFGRTLRGRVTIGSIALGRHGAAFPAFCRCCRCSLKAGLWLFTVQMFLKCRILTLYAPQDHLFCVKSLATATPISRAIATPLRRV
jgi:hypothetical protein